MPSEEKYMELFSAGGKLSEGLIRLDGHPLQAPGFFQKRKLKKAKELFEQAALESPENAAPLLMLAKVNESLGNPEKALSWLQRAWLLQPGNLILTIELSGAYGLVGKYQEAIAVLVEGKKFYPAEPRILFNLGVSFLLIGEANAAANVFSEATLIEPEYEMNHKILSYAKDVANGVKAKPRTQSDIAKNI